MQKQLILFPRISIFPSPPPRKINLELLSCTCRQLRVPHVLQQVTCFSSSLPTSYTNLLQSALVSLLLGEVGFLAEHRRINVAITRARRHLAIVGDSETVSHDDFLKSLVEYMNSQGEVRSAHEYLQDSFSSAVDSYTNEHDEVLLTQTTRDYKKKKGVNEQKATVSNENDAKQREELNVVDAVENRSINESEISEADKASEQESSKVSSETSAVSERFSAKTAGQKEMNEPFLFSSNNATTKYSRETLEKEIVDFIQDGAKFELSFPKTLNSQQRFDVHSIAEKLSLCHESRGEGKERYIVVRKAKPASIGLFMVSMSSLVLDKRNLEPG